MSMYIQNFYERRAEHLSRKIICYTEVEKVPKEVKDFVGNNGLVQHNIILLEVFSYPYEPNIYVIYDNENISAVYSIVIYHGVHGKVAYSLPFYSYSGYIGDGSIFSYVIEDLQRREVITLSNCYHPYFKYEKSSVKTKSMNKFFQYIDLRNETYFTQMNSKQRNNLKRNFKRAVDSKVVVEKSRNLADLKIWYEQIYVSRMKETGANIYPLSVYIKLLHQELQSKVSFVIAKIGELIIGGAFYLKQPYSYDLFMRVVATKYLDTQAGVMIDKWILDEAVANKISYFNWQSADIEGSPIFKYKAAWGSKVGYYEYSTVLLNSLDTIKKIKKEDLPMYYPGMFIAPYEVIYNE